MYNKQFSNEFNEFQEDLLTPDEELQSKIRDIGERKAQLQERLNTLEKHEKKIQSDNNILYAILTDIVGSFKNHNPKLGDLSAQQTYIMDRRKFLFIDIFCERLKFLLLRCNYGPNRCTCTKINEKSIGN